MDDTQEESLFEAPPIAEQERMVEAILFASAEPVSLREMAVDSKMASYDMCLTEAMGNKNKLKFLS